MPGPVYDVKLHPVQAMMLNRPTHSDGAGRAVSDISCGPWRDPLNHHFASGAVWTQNSAVLPGANYGLNCGDSGSRVSLVLGGRGTCKLRSMAHHRMACGGTILRHGQQMASQTLMSTRSVVHRCTTWYLTWRPRETTRWGHDIGCLNHCARRYARRRRESPAAMG